MVDKSHDEPMKQPSPAAAALIQALGGEAPDVDATARLIEADERDAKRYRRLRILGAAPGGSKQLDQGTVLRFSNLDLFLDDDLRIHASRGEAREARSSSVDALRARYQDGQLYMRSRVADVLRGDHPTLAVMVEKLPAHGAPSEEDRLDAVLAEARRVTKPLCDEELAAERVTSDILNMRLDSALQARVQQLDLKWAATSLFIRDVIEALGEPEPAKAAVVNLPDIAMRVVGQIEQLKSEVATNEARVHQIEQERESANARFCEAHRGEYKTSGCVVCGLMTHGSDEKALRDRAEAAEAWVSHLEQENHGLHEALEAWKDAIFTSDGTISADNEELVEASYALHAAAFSSRETKGTDR